MKQKISILLAILFLTVTNLFAQTSLEKAEEAFNKQDFSNVIKWFETAGKQ